MRARPALKSRNLVSTELALPNGTNHTDRRQSHAQGPTFSHAHTALRLDHKRTWTAEAIETGEANTASAAAAAPAALQRSATTPHTARPHAPEAQAKPPQPPSLPEWPALVPPPPPQPPQPQGPPPPPPHRRRPTAQGSRRNAAEPPATECSAAIPLPRQCRPVCSRWQLTSDACCAPPAAAT